MQNFDLAALGIRVPFLSKPSMRATADKVTTDLMSSRPLSHWLKEGWSFDNNWPRIGQALGGIEKIEGQSLQAEFGEGVLGRYGASERTIYVDESVAKATDDPRRAFVLWHECAHDVLHRGFLVLAESAGRRLPADSEVTLSDKEERGMEFQASYTGGHLAAPGGFLRAVMMKVLRRTEFPYKAGEPHRLGGAPCYPSSLEECARYVATELQEKFGGLSAQALGLRLVEEGLVYPFGERPAKVFVFRKSKPLRPRVRGSGAVA